VTLRPHQAQMQQLCIEILSGAPVRQIIASVTPGGGKSALPVILASMLLPAVADKLLWIVPRNSLKWQGEAEFLDPRWETPRRLRACNGNDEHADRGTDGYLTTYQAIGMSPAGHMDYVSRHRTILFLDEPHHVAEGQSWADALRPMINAAVLVVYASGTLARADGVQIAGLEYLDGLVDLRDTAHTRVIRYGRKLALADRATCTIEPVVIDGAARWMSKEGAARQVDSLRRASESRADAVFTALRTDFAFALLAECMSAWDAHRADYPTAKLLVVAPDIETAKAYHSRIASRCLAEIATSDDTPGARRSIEAFKLGSIPALVTVGMAYEGLSVPEITHIACLTQIRSVPWLEQMQARGNRVAPGKRQAWVYAPADSAFLKAWRMIEDEALVPTSDAGGRQERGAGSSDDGMGLAPPTIKPLWSTAHGVDAELPFVATVAPSVAESVLIDNIRAIRRQVVDNARPGSQKALATVFNAQVRGVADKALEDLTGDELTAVWLRVREVFRGRL
jgi:superfamily II DNA or RNA helicase